MPDHQLENVTQVLDVNDEAEDQQPKQRLGRNLSQDVARQNPHGLRRVEWTSPCRDVPAERSLRRHFPVSHCQIQPYASMVILCPESRRAPRQKLKRGSPSTS